VHQARPISLVVGAPVNRYPSGNTRGAKRGSKHRATILAETLLDGDADRLTRRCIAEAMKGEPVAMRLCMERLIAPQKARPFKF
jgi:hypothetical protein